MSRKGVLSVLAMALILLAACGPPPWKPATPSAVPAATATEQGTMDDTAGLPGTQDEERSVALCVADLAEQLEVSEGDIQVLSAEPVNWPDTSLGCPEPGMMYAQVITPGFQVTLQAGGKDYEYHTDGKRAVTCGRN